MLDMRNTRPEVVLPGIEKALQLLIRQNLMAVIKVINKE